MFKNYGVKYIEKFIHDEHTQKNHVKNYIIFWEMPKRQISDKKIYYLL
jgi:hypothetical protein